jgi:hypothetical protein
MHLKLTLLLATALASTLQATPHGTLLEKRPLSALEKRLAEIDSQLNELANYGLVSSIGAIGHRSLEHQTAHHPEWIQIDWDTAVPLDEVLLVPTIHRDALEEFQPDAFPQSFRLVAGTNSSSNGTVIAEFNPQDNIKPGVAPFVIPCNGTPASWIRIESTQLAQRAFDSQYVFQFSEILAFSGEKNMALKKP